MPSGPATVTEALECAAAVHGAREAYVHGGRRITYGDLRASSAAIARALRDDAGVQPGDVVMLLVPSSIEFAQCYLAAVRLRAITTAVNQRLGARERASIVARTTPRVTVAPDGVDVPDYAGTVVRVSELAALARGAELAPPRDVSPHETVTIVWTSGTTGAPKGAMHDHTAMVAIHEGMGELTAPGDRRLVSLPFAHTGYMTRVYDEIVQGTTLVLVGEPWSAAQQIRLIEAERITMATGVPTQWSLVLAHPDLATTDRSSLRLAGIGAAAVDPSLIRAVREALGCPVMNRYTSTEAGLATGTRLGDPDDVVATTVGRPAPNVTLRIAGTDAGGVGEIRLRSPAMFTGYWRDPELTRAALDDDGFLRTGDLGRLRPDGNLEIVGRLKEMYIRGGYNVYPAEVEAVIAEHPAVAQAAVVGAPAPVLGEVGVAFVVVRSGAAPPELAEVRDWCAARLADYKSPDRLVVVDALPVNASHKVDKQALSETAKEHV